MEGRPVFKQLEDVPEQVAGDRCLLRELFHPDRDPVSIRYSLAHAYVEPGGQTVEHYLEQSELYYVIRGHGTMVLDGAPYPVREGTSYCIPPHCRQHLVNNSHERFEFLCIVDPPWTPEGETVLE